jgi:hypothetical protein
VPKELLNFSELEMGDNFWDSFDLVKIDLSNNQIDEIPNELGT